MPDAPRHLVDEATAPWWRALDRRRLTVAIGTTLLALPILVLDNLPTGANSAEAVETEVPATAPTSTTVVVTTTAAPTTTTPPTTAAPTTTTAPPTTAPPRVTTTTRAPAPPPTTPPTTVAAVEPVAPPATTAPPAAANEERGKATWYHWNPGECAHKTLPKGTTVTVTDVATGASTTCVVTDRGPYGAGRIIDLDSTVFDDLAGLGTGVIDVVITW